MIIKTVLSLLFFFFYTNKVMETHRVARQCGTLYIDTPHDPVWAWQHYRWPWCGCATVVISHELLHHDHQLCGATHFCALPALYIMRCLIDWFGHIQHNVPLQHMHTHLRLVGPRHAAQFGRGARARAHFWCHIGLRTVYPCASLTSRFNLMRF